ncbi:GNAT family N-acetyltransferase [Pseudoxanthomonas dokdonensis]|uniref:Acetyltransferase n=1 Tax=Pseudoxanthomonas dokdonensis TaxID=344882 RepID=A0A0R0CVE6_9GAMM|nr:GNAT family protein [Pseudoxanthomonas dokdonensis]KRG70087.1 acetyltransferase [Pseudoxanthomonas dokdonensis]
MPESDPLRLQGQGFVLRRWSPHDLRSLVRHANDAEVARGLSSRFPHPYRRLDGVRFLAGEVVDLRDPVLAIEIDGVACGGIGAHPASGERAGVAELGYWLGRRYWGQGIMTRVLDCYVPWVMRELSLHRLQAQVLVSNPASAAVLAKCGFEQEGIQRQAVLRAGKPQDLRLFSLILPLPDAIAANALPAVSSMAIDHE